MGHLDQFLECFSVFLPPSSPFNYYYIIIVIIVVIIDEVNIIIVIINEVKYTCV